MTRILCAGLVTVDLVYRVDRIPGIDEKAQAGSMEIAAGGPAANAAVTAAALGAEVTLVTAVGAHPLGDLVRADLETHGVRLVDAAREQPAPPPVSAVTVLDATGQRTIVSRNAGDLTVRVPPAGLPDADLTLVDGHHPALAIAAARSARRLLVDAGTWRPVFAGLLPRAEVVACSAAFRHPTQTTPTDESLAIAIGAALPDPEDTGPGAAQTPTRPHPARIPAPSHAAPYVVVTHGPDPVRWFGAGLAGEVPVPPVRAVDTAGAGDAFHGALAVALADIPSPAHAAHPLPAAHPAAAPLTGPTNLIYPEISGFVEAIAFAVRVAGVRVAHRGPRSWLAALTARDS